MTRISRPTSTGKRQHLADGYERPEPPTAEVIGHARTWTERRLAMSQAAVEAIMTRRRVQGLLAVRYSKRVRQRPPGRYSSRPATVGVERDIGVKVVVDRTDVVTAIGRLGWRVYATNAPSNQLLLSQAVLAYLSRCLLERFHGLPLPVIRRSRRRRSHLTSLSHVQRRILALLNFPVGVYARLCPDSHKPP